jgi:hypothetical protein
MQYAGYGIVFRAFLPWIISFTLRPGMTVAITTVAPVEAPEIA